MKLNTDLIQNIQRMRRFMKIIKYFIAGFVIFFAGLFSNGYAFSQSTITNYQATFIPVYDKSNNFNIAIRMYDTNSGLYFLCVDPNTLQTKTLPASQVRFRGTNQDMKGNYFYFQKLAATPYMRLLNNFSRSPYQAENYGVTRAKNHPGGVFVTIDMCPSTQPFEKKLFSTLASLADKARQPIPIAISMSATWLLAHQQEFQWLLKEQAEKRLAITWINHSFSHPYYLDVPIKDNFLVFNAKYFEQEVLMTEKLLLEQGQKPSIYFRFPGLISNEDLIKRLKDLGLIAIGADAWFAKNQMPQDGSFILIHGNGNEPKGVDKFLSILKRDALHFLTLDIGVLSTVR